MNPPDLEFWGRTFGLLAVEVAILALLAGIGAGRLRTPSGRKRLWQGVLLASIALFVGEASGAGGLWKRILERAGAPPVVARRVVATVASGTVSAMPETMDVVLPNVASRTDVPAVPRPVWWPLWIWLAGFGVVGGRACWIRFRVLREWRRALPADADSEAILKRLEPKLGLRRVRLCAWSRLPGPVAFGVFHPTVAVPADVGSRFSVAQQEAMMAHELAHLAGSDPLWLVLTDVQCALLWWHPAAWAIRRRFQSEAEATADTASSLVPEGPGALAESLVLLGRTLHPVGLVRGLGVSGGRFRSELGRRVESLLRQESEWRPLRRRDWMLRTGMALLVAGLLPALPIPGRMEQSPLGAVMAAARARETAVAVQGSAAPVQSPVPRVETPAVVEGNSAQILSTSPGGLGLKYELPTVHTVKQAYVALREVTPQDLLPPRKYGATYFFETNNTSASSTPEMVTRTYRVDVPRLESAIRAMVPVPPNEAPGSRLLDFLSECGVVFPASVTPGTPGDPPSSVPAIFLNATRGILFVRASLPDLDALERVLGGVQAGIAPESPPAPRITLNTWFAEITAGGPEDLGLDWVFGVSPTNNAVAETAPLASGRGRVETLRNQGQRATLSGSQFAALRQRLEGRSGVDLLHAPPVTAATGREARIQVQDVRTIVTGVTARVDSAAEAAGFDGVAVSTSIVPAVIEYQTEQMKFGPELTVLPEVDRDADGALWDLRISARVTEFLGYEDPGASQATIRSAGVKPLKATPPLPRLRRREASADVRVRSGEVVALRGPMVETQSVEEGGVFRRGATNVVRKRLYAFVETEAAAPGTVGIESAAPPAFPFVVRIPPSGDTCRIGEREVREFELTGVIRSLALAHPGMVLLIRNEAEASETLTRRVQDAAMEAGVANLLLRPEPR